MKLEWVTCANSEVRSLSFPPLVGNGSPTLRSTINDCELSFLPLVGNGFLVENLISYSIKITEAFRLDYVVNLKVNKRKGVISK